MSARVRVCVGGRVTVHESVCTRTLVCVHMGEHVCVCTPEHTRRHTHPEHWDGRRGKGSPGLPQAPSSPAGKIEGRAPNNPPAQMEGPPNGATWVEVEDESEESGATRSQGSSPRK